jgi:hypothetical protein
MGRVSFPLLYIIGRVKLYAKLQEKVGEDEPEKSFDMQKQGIGKSHGSWFSSSSSVTLLASQEAISGINSRITSNSFIYRDGTGLNTLQMD